MGCRRSEATRSFRNTTWSVTFAKRNTAWLAAAPTRFSAASSPRRWEFGDDLRLDAGPQDLRRFSACHEHHSTAAVAPRTRSIISSIVYTARRERRRNSPHIRLTTSQVDNQGALRHTLKNKQLFVLWLDAQGCELKPNAGGSNETNRIER